MEREQPMIMVGAGFEEINVAVAAAVREQMAVVVQEITPTLTEPLAEATAILKQAVVTVRRYRLALYFAGFVIGLESAVLLVLLAHH